MSEWHEAEEHVERAHQHYEAGRWDEAERELRKALSSNPYQVEWHFNLGLTLDAAGRFAEAVSAFGQAHALEPEDAPICVMLGVTTLKAGDAEGALEWLARAESRGASGAEAGRGVSPGMTVGMSVAVHRIEALARLGRHEEAETAFYVAQELDGSCRSVRWPSRCLSVTAREGDLVPARGGRLARASRSMRGWRRRTRRGG